MKRRWSHKYNAWEYFDITEADRRKLRERAGISLTRGVTSLTIRENIPWTAALLELITDSFGRE